MPKSRARPFAYEELSDDHVHLPCGRRWIAAPVAVNHGIRSSLSRFLDFDEAVECGPAVMHHLEVVTDDAYLEPLSPEVLRAIDALATSALPWRSEHGDGPEPVTKPRRVPLARLAVAEYPVNWVRRAGWSWYDVFDNTEGIQARGLLTSALLQILDKSEEEGALTLLSGSVFVYRELHVHPTVRGQHLGARLMAHALASLPRTDEDLSLLVAFPIASIWDAVGDDGERPPPDRSAAAVQQLARYYERLGFRRWYMNGAGHRIPRPRRREDERNEPQALYFRHDRRLPFLPERGDEE